MSDTREKDGREPGFRVIDKRGMSDEERAKEFPPAPGAAPPPPAGATAAAPPPPGPSAPDRGAAAPPPPGDAPSPPPPSPPPAGEASSPPAGNRPPGEGVEPGRRSGAGSRRESRFGPPGFADLVAAFQVPAMIHLGMMAPPGSGGRALPPNLEAAKDVIDMLGVLQEKTKGNLEKSEEELLTGLLYELRMVYLEILNSVAGTKGGSHP